MTRMFTFPTPDAGGDPPRDERLGALLRDAVGEPPVADVDWTGLAERVSAAVRGQHGLPWWGHVGRWQRHALPLALAAGLVGGLALWRAGAAPRVELTAGYGDLVTAVASAGASPDDAAVIYAGSVASALDPAGSVPE